MAKAPNLSVALVTGAASGIDQELAIYWAKDQYQLILVDQNPSGLPPDGLTAAKLLPLSFYN